MSDVLLFADHRFDLWKARIKNVEQAFRNRATALVVDIVGTLLHPKPRAICICTAPHPEAFDHIGWARCQNCQDYLSRERCVDRGIIP